MSNQDIYRLRYSEVAFKASHNSYDRDEKPITTQTGWSSKNQYQGGCRGLELDIHQSEQLWLWSVAHFWIAVVWELRSSADCKMRSGFQFSLMCSGRSIFGVVEYREKSLNSAQ